VGAVRRIIFLIARNVNQRYETTCIEVTEEHFIIPEIILRSARKARKARKGKVFRD